MDRAPSPFPWVRVSIVLLVAGYVLFLLASVLLTESGLFHQELYELDARRLAALPGLLVLFALGRLVLSFLPPGRIGSHRPADLPVTLAASFLLGTLAAAAEMVLLPPERGAAYLAVFFAPWVLLAALRLATLPGAMAPRHELEHERAGRATRIVRGAALAMAVALVVAGLSAVPFHTSHPVPPHVPFDPVDLFPEHPPSTGIEAEDASLLPATSWTLLVLLATKEHAAVAWHLHAAACALALLVLFARGLLDARRAPFGRAVAVFFVTVVLLGATAVDTTWESARSSQRLALLAGVAWSVPWLRRADRRAGVLSALAFGACALSGAWELALAGWLGLVVAAPVPMRRRALSQSLGSAAGAALLLLGASLHDPAFAPAFPSAAAAADPPLPLWVHVGCGALVLAGTAVLQRRLRAVEPGAVDPPRRELWVIALPIAAGIVFWRDLAEALPVVLFLAALAFTRPERPALAP